MASETDNADQHPDKGQYPLYQPVSDAEIDLLRAFVGDIIDQLLLSEADNLEGNKP